MDLIGSARDDDGALLYPAELAAHRAKCDRRVLQGRAQERIGVAVLANAHRGAGPKPRNGFAAADVERIRSEWFEKHEAVDPDEVTGVAGSSREDALAYLNAIRGQRELATEHLDASHHMAAALSSNTRALGRLLGWQPPT